MTVENDSLFRQEKMQKYREVFTQIFRYIPWLEQKQGMRTSHVYDGDNSPSNSVPVVVYDSTLLGFVKEMQATGLMDRNYVYVYSRRGIRTAADELKMIEEAEFRDIEDIFGVIAKYVLGGMTKGQMWCMAIENGVFYHAILKIKELLEVWDKPLA